VNTADATAAAAAARSTGRYALVPAACTQEAYPRELRE
jgi:hypothetical protein